MAGGLALVAVAARLLLTRHGLDWPGEEVVWELRLLGAACAVTVGAALGVAGVLLQSLVRNPLASPDLLGLSAGASLAVVLSEPAVSGVWRAGPATVGAGAALGVVFALSRGRAGLDRTGVVLTGVVVAVTCGAATALVRHLRPGITIGADRALVGAISDDATWVQVGAAGGVTVLGVLVALLLARGLDAAALSDDEAASVGVAVGRLRVVTFVLSGVLSAAAVVLAGPVGFVGLIAPHAVRLLAGPGHRVLLPGALLAGAGFVCAADALTRVLATGSGRLPLGVVTALLGGPVFLWLLNRTLRRGPGW